MSIALSLTPAFILHRKAYSDSSLIVDFFTLHNGRVSCIAKGVKTSKNRKAAILQPFIPLMINFSGRAELKTLRECEAVDNGYKLQTDSLYTAFYANELLLKFLHKQQIHKNLFALYSRLLQQLDNDMQSTESLLRVFEANLLDETGFGLQLTHEAKKHTPLDPEKRYIYILETGPVEAPAVMESHTAYPLMTGDSLLALKQGHFSSKQQLRECKTLMRYAIRSHLGGYDFKTREFFLQNTDRN